MNTGPSRVSPEAIRAFERGLEAVFAADTVKELLDSVDVRALLSGEDLEDPIDYEGMGELVGQMAGRLVVKRTVGQFTPGQAVEQTVGYAIGGLVGRATVRTIARSDPERVAAAIERQFYPHHRTDPLPGGVTDGDKEPSRYVIEIEDPAEEDSPEGGPESDGQLSNGDDPSTGEGDPPLGEDEQAGEDDSFETDTVGDGDDWRETDGDETSRVRDDGRGDDDDAGRF